MKNIPKDKLLDLFMGSLKETTQHEVSLLKHKSLDKDFNVVTRFGGKNKTYTRRVPLNPIGSAMFPLIT